MKLLLLSLNIAGTSHCNVDPCDLTVGDELHLINEPQNEFDRNAIRVHHGVAMKLGYIPKESTVIIHDYIKRTGALPKCYIADIDTRSRTPKILLRGTIDTDTPETKPPTI